MKRLFLSLTFCIFSFSSLVQAQVVPGWLRASKISPDGQTVAFVYQGDIFTVSVKGGQACQLTSGSAYDSDPIWSPDGKFIVFSSTREDSKDIWKIPAQGGKALKLTDYQGAETPLAISPDQNVIFQANIQPDTRSSVYPNQSQTYSVPLTGGKVVRYLPFQTSAMSFSAEGKLIYEDYKGYEDPLRKHHTSSVTRDIWLKEGESFRKLSDFAGEDRNPVFASDGNTYYYLSEREGDCFNVWSSSLSNPSESVRVTSFKTHPVRNLSISSDGTLLFSWNGDLYTCKKGAEPQKLNITLVKDSHDRDLIRRSILGGVSSISPAVSGKEIAVVANGEVYACAVDFKSTRRITNTASQERGVSFAPDGRTIYYAAERNGHWGIWRSSLVNKDDKLFCLSYDFKEELFTEPGQTCFQPAVSPDGKWVAFLRDRTELVIKSTKGKQEKSLIKDVNYSYSDGDLSFAWSPDSRYILSDYMIHGGWNNTDIAAVDIESGEVLNLSQSGYSDGGFRWAMGGKAMTWKSDKNGYRSHGSWGSEDDVFVMFFDAEAYRKFACSENEQKIIKEMELSDKGKNDEKAEKKAQKDSLKAAEKAEKLELDFENRFDRIVRLTPSAGRLGDYILSPDGTKLYYCVRLESGMDLCCRDLKSGNVKVVSKGVGGRFVADAEGKSVYITSLFGVSKMDLNSGKKTSISTGGEFDYKPAQEREYIFEHCWKQVQEKFYDKNIHGVDWKLMHDNYAQFLPYINNNYDFQDLLSEMLGELNGSHTGARYRPKTDRNLGYLGVIFDMEYSGKGLRIESVLPGSPLAMQVPDLKAGDIITKLNGVEIPANSVWYEVFDRTGGNRVELVVKCSGKEKKAALVMEKSQSALYYRAWVRRNEELVEKLSGGKVGYVHVKGMDSESFREVYSKALGRYRHCEALVVDTRHNGGGWLHDDLATFLNGKAYAEFRPRGQYVGTEPFSKWTKPSCVLVCEDNYSDASGFPYVYKTLGIGKLVGTSVPGTMTAVWWETQVDRTLVFGIPQVTVWGLAEDRALENMSIDPDIEVYNDPASVIRGEDKQLEAAVLSLMKK